MLPRMNNHLREMLSDFPRKRRQLYELGASANDRTNLHGIRATITDWVLMSLPRINCVSLTGQRQVWVMNSKMAAFLAVRI
jgi:hypothetical protein